MFPNSIKHNSFWLVLDSMNLKPIKRNYVWAPVHFWPWPKSLWLLERPNHWVETDFFLLFSRKTFIQERKTSCHTNSIHRPQSSNQRYFEPYFWYEFSILGCFGQSRLQRKKNQSCHNYATFAEVFFYVPSALKSCIICLLINLYFFYSK